MIQHEIRSSLGLVFFYEHFLKRGKGIKIALFDSGAIGFKKPFLDKKLPYHLIKDISYPLPTAVSLFSLKVQNKKTVFFPQEHKKWILNPIAPSQCHFFKGGLLDTKSLFFKLNINPSYFQLNQGFEASFSYPVLICFQSKMEPKFLWIDLDQDGVFRSKERVPMSFKKASFLRLHPTDQKTWFLKIKLLSQKKLKLSWITHPHASAMGSLMSSSHPILKGMAPQASLISVMTLPFQTNTFYRLSTFLKQLLRAQKAGVDLFHFSISLSGGDRISQAFLRAFFQKEILQKGKVIVFASGNEGPFFKKALLQNYFPEDAFVIGAFLPKRLSRFFLKNPSLHAWIPPYSLSGVSYSMRLFPDFLAPMGLPFWNIETRQIEIGEGTSTSAAIFTGALASMLSALKAKKIPIDPSVLKKALFQSAKKRALQTQSVRFHTPGVPHFGNAFFLYQKLIKKKHTHFPSILIRKLKTKHFSSASQSSNTQVFALKLPKDFPKDSLKIVLNPNKKQNSIHLSTQALVLTKKNWTSFSIKWIPPQAPSATTTSTSISSEIQLRTLDHQLLKHIPVFFQKLKLLSFLKKEIFFSKTFTPSSVLRIPFRLTQKSALFFKAEARPQLPRTPHRSILVLQVFSHKQWDTPVLEKTFLMEPKKKTLKITSNRFFSKGDYTLLAFQSFSIPTHASLFSLKGTLKSIPITITSIRFKKGISNQNWLTVSGTKSSEILFSKDAPLLELTHRKKELLLKRDLLDPDPTYEGLLTPGSLKEDGLLMYRFRFSHPLMQSSYQNPIFSNIVFYQKKPFQLLFSWTQAPIPSMFFKKANLLLESNAPIFFRMKINFLSNASIKKLPKKIPVLFQIPLKHPWVDSAHFLKKTQKKFVFSFKIPKSYQNASSLKGVLHIFFKNQDTLKISIP